MRHTGGGDSMFSMDTHTYTHTYSVYAIIDVHTLYNAII